MMSEQKGIILSGMRPTGKLHLGHLVGALENWVGLQDTYECNFLVADLHVLTTGFDKSAEIPDNIQVQHQCVWPPQEICPVPVWVGVDRLPL